MPNFSSRVGACAAFAFYIGVVSGSGLAQEKSPPSLEQVIEGLQNTESLLFGSKSLLMRYERTKSENVTKNSNRAGDLLLVEWTFAFKDNKWFSQHRFTHPGGNENGSVVPAEPFVDVAKDGLTLFWNKYKSGFAAVNKVDLRNNLYWNEYTKNLSLNLPKYVARAGGVEGRMYEIRKKDRDNVDLPFLPDFLVENKEHYRVLPSSETVDGASCWIVEWPGMDRFCVDPKRGFAVLQRSYSWGPGKPMRYNLVNKDYRQVRPGLWLPDTQVQDRYYDPAQAAPDLAGKVRYRTEYKSRAIEFDDLTDAFFDVELPPKTMVLDEVRKFRYTVGEKNAKPFALPLAQAQAEAQQSRGRYWLLALNVLIVLVLAVVVLRRYLRGLVLPRST